MERIQQIKRKGLPRGLKLKSPGTSLFVQWLGHGAFTAVAHVWSLVRIEQDHSTSHIMQPKKKKAICSVQLLSHVWLFATPCTIARQISLSITSSWSLLKLMSIKSVMPSNHLILCHPLLLLPSIFPSIRSFLVSQFFASGGQSNGISASASVLPMNIQDWFPLR